MTNKFLRACITGGGGGGKGWVKVPSLRVVCAHACCPVISQASSLSSLECSVHEITKCIKTSNPD